jgi:FkbM family methyltransferase
VRSTTTLEIVGGVRVVVPDSLNLITTYVLREQGDWFEDEIKFLRKLLQSGQRVVDIGANYGVYTLTMAKLVGNDGRVWAFEPASSTAKHLGESIAANEFGHVVLEQVALSNQKGTAQLSLNDNAELNTLVRGGDSASATETVPLVTLDERMEFHGWDGIEFLKLDAEGEESNILRGGTGFFATQSPLVQYEVREGADLHLELVQAFDALGYSSYRLVPGLDCLIPFDKNEPVDGYLLNLFCCKPDRAGQLAARGLLVESVSDTPRALPASGAWLDTLMDLPYGRACAEVWRRTAGAGLDEDVEAALSCYVQSRDPDLGAGERFSALDESFTRLAALCETRPDYLRLASLARVAREHGARALAVNALSQLCDNIFLHQKADPAEPFLAPGERFDSVPPGSSLGNWIGAAALEELERNAGFSSFYTGAAARQRLSLIRDLGFGSDEMNRRLSLLEQRFG